MNKINKYWPGGIVKGAFKFGNLLDDIARATKNSPLDFSDWGKIYRADMMKIPGNKEIVQQLSDSQLGYLLYGRSEQILKGTPNRYAIFNGSDPMSVKRINIFDAPNKNVGYLIPEYHDVVPGTVSTHFVENLTNGASQGISESGYNALMNITGKPLSANRIWKMPEITSRVYAKFTPGISNPAYPMSQEWPINSIRTSGYKPRWWTSSNKSWDDEFQQMMKKLNADAGIDSGFDARFTTLDDDLEFNPISVISKSADDFHEDIVRSPIQKIRPVITGPNQFIPTKHEHLFQIGPKTVQNGVPVVNWLDPNIWLKNGGKIEKFQKGKIITGLFKQWGDDLTRTIKSTRLNHALNGKPVKKYIDQELKYAYPGIMEGFKRPEPKILLMPESLKMPTNYSTFYKGLQDLAWTNPEFRHLAGYGATPISISQFDDVMGGVRSSINQNTKFADDVNQILNIKALSNPKHNSLENLIKFDTNSLYDHVIGTGAESLVFKMGTDPAYIYKTPAGFELINGRVNDKLNWVPISGTNVDEMYNTALKFANDFNSKHLFQEPLSLIGYRRARRLHGPTEYVPVFKQLKASELFDDSIPVVSDTFFDMQVFDPTKALRLQPEQMIKQLSNSSYKGLLPQAKSILIDFPKNNILLENSQLQPTIIDPHFGNWGIFNGKLRGIDLHKKGGKVK